MRLRTWIPGASRPIFAPSVALGALLLVGNALAQSDWENQSSPGTNVWALQSVSASQSAAFQVAGRTYARTVKGTPFGSRQPMEMTYSLAFREDGLVEDNSATFFGNPPETLPYEQVGNRVTITQASGTSVYILDESGTSLTGEAGAVYTLVGE